MMMLTFTQRDRLKQSGCDLFIGAAQLVREGPEVVARVCRSSECVDIHAKQICIATGETSLVSFPLT